MSEFKHTPGPWYANKKQHHQNFIEIEHLDTSVGGSSKVLARVVVRQSWLEEQEANARLIAAAPDLLEALIELNDSYCGGCYYNPSTDVMEAVNAAIAKATGASNDY